MDFFPSANSCKTNAPPIDTLVIAALICFFLYVEIFHEKLDSFFCYTNTVYFAIVSIHIYTCVMCNMDSNIFECHRIRLDHCHGNTIISSFQFLLASSLVEQIILHEFSRFISKRGKEMQKKRMGKKYERCSTSKCAHRSRMSHTHT